MTTQVLGGGNAKGGEQKRINDEFKAKEDKKKEQEAKFLLSTLFKSATAVQQQTLREGEDPKSVL